MTNIFKDAETEIAKGFHLLESWWGSEPKYANALGIGVNIIGVAVETVFTLEGNVAGATAVGTIVSTIQQKLAAATQLVKAVGPTPTVKTLLSGVATDISSLEGAVDIKDPRSQAAVTLAANTINGLVEAFPVADPAPASTTPAAATT